EPLGDLGARPAAHAAVRLPGHDPVGAGLGGQLHGELGAVGFAQRLPHGHRGRRPGDLVTGGDHGVYASRRRVGDLAVGDHTTTVTHTDVFTRPHSQRVARVPSLGAVERHRAIHLAYLGGPEERRGHGAARRGSWVTAFSVPRPRRAGGRTGHPDGRCPR